MGQFFQFLLLLFHFAQGLFKPQLIPLQIPNFRLGIQKFLGQNFSYVIIRLDVIDFKGPILELQIPAKQVSRNRVNQLRVWVWKDVGIAQDDTVCEIWQNICLSLLGNQANFLEEIGNFRQIDPNHGAVLR